MAGREQVRGGGKISNFDTQSAKNLDEKLCMMPKSLN